MLLQATCPSANFLTGSLYIALAGLELGQVPASTPGFSSTATSLQGAAEAVACDKHCAPCEGTAVTLCLTLFPPWVTWGWRAAMLVAFCCCNQIPQQKQVKVEVFILDDSLTAHSSLWQAAIM